MSESYRFSGYAARILPFSLGRAVMRRAIIIRQHGFSEGREIKLDEQKWNLASYVREFFSCNLEINLKRSNVFYKGWRIEVIDSVTHRAAASENGLKTILDISSMLEIAADLTGRIKAGPMQLP